MNTATNNNESQKMKKGFNPKSKDSHFTDDDSNESGTQMRSSSDSFSSGASKASDKSSQEGGSVRSFREEGSSAHRKSGEESKSGQQQQQSQNRAEGSKVEAKVQSSKSEGSEHQSESDEKSDSKSKKAGGFVEQLDLALVDASISIGDVVKKIDALAPKEGGIARLSQYTVQKLEGVQNYIGDNGSKEMIASAWSLVRRSPWPVGLALVGAGIGYYIQRATSKTEATKKSASSEKSAA